jgi:hypothetical protein
VGGADVAVAAIRQLALEFGHESTSSGGLDQAIATLPSQSQDVVRNAAEQGFLHGMNEILLLGAILSLLGSVLALWLVREHEIERETVVEERERVEPALEGANA